MSKDFVANPSLLDEERSERFLDTCLSILKTVVVDLNYESKGGEFDYKSVLKSPKQSTELAKNILASYEKDVAREKAELFDKLGRNLIGCVYKALAARIGEKVAAVGAIGICGSAKPLTSG